MPQTPSRSPQRTNRPHAWSDQSVPLPAILATLVGICLLGGFWLNLRQIRFWPESVKLAFVTTASFLLLWGVTELLSGLLFRWLGWGDREKNVIQPRLGTASWMGIVLVSLGAGSLLFVPWQSRLGAIPIIMLIAGIACLIYGAKRFVDRILRASGPRQGERQSVSLTSAGGVSLAVAIIFLIGAFLGPSNMLMLMFAAVAGPFIMNGWYAFRMIRRLELTRDLPAQIVAGDPITVTVSLRNRKRFMSTWLMGVADSITRETGSTYQAPLVAETLFQRVPPRETRDASYRLRLLQRGLYTFGPVRVRSRFPLGLVERHRVFPAPAEMIVAPRLGRLTDRWYHETMSADELVLRQRPRQGVFPDEFEKLRGFRYGDNPRMIHWRSSARQNSLMVREYQEIRDRDLIVLVDFSGTEEDEQRALNLEKALSFAATVCVDQLRRSRQSQMGVAVAGDHLTTWTGVAHPTNAEELLKRLAVVEPAEQPDLTAMWDFARERRTATTAGICITTRHPDELAGANTANWIRFISVLDESFTDYFRLN